MVSVKQVQILLFQWGYSGITAIRPRSFACVLYEKNKSRLFNNLLCLYGGKNTTYRTEWYVYFYNIKQKENKPHWTEGKNKSLGK